MSPKQTPTVLPPKEQNLFKNVVRFYETKQLKKALKSADAILKRFPDHGETLAMKGLTLNALDKKADAHELVRRGLLMDMRSHICWHVYGLLYRSERDYREAAKAYLNALRIDKDNQQILRDLALLQIQIRDYDGLEETRRTLLTVRPNQRNNWIGFALSFHLLGNYATAVSVLDTYQDTLKQSNELDDRYEVSELLLYKNLILEESGDHAAALAHLDESAPKVVDRLAVRETRARLLSALGRYEESAGELSKLLSVNPDNRIYHKGLQACALYAASKAPEASLNGNTGDQGTEPQKSKLDPRLHYSSKKLRDLEMRILGPVPSIQSDQDASCALKVCNELTAKYPRSRTAQRLALDILPSGLHPEFLPRADAYVRRFLRKGVPSLFSDVKQLYADSSKADVFGSLFDGYRAFLENPEKARLPRLTPMPKEASDVVLPESIKDDVEEEPPCTLLWVLHFLAQHYDRLGKRDLALETIEAAIEHTPTAIECYLVKARILKHCGDLKGAVQVADDGRNLDLADRYLNTKCAKYALRADMVSDGEAWVGLFTRDADSGGVQALYEMQCMWFELGAAESHLRRGQLSLALKKFTAVDRHFADMVEDQFDFHSYCLRKVTLRAYVSLLRFEDRIREHPYFARAAGGLVKCLLRLHGLSERERVVITGEHSDIEGFAQMTDAERKKAVSKRKKQLARQKQTHQGSGGGKGAGKASTGKSGTGRPNAHRPSTGKPLANGTDKTQGAGKESTGKSSGKSSGSSGNENKAKANLGWMESDPTGIERVKELFKKDAKDAILEEASRVVRELHRHLEGQMQTQVLSFELALRKGKYLQALRAVRYAQRYNADNPQTLLIAVRLGHELSRPEVTKGFSEPVRSVFDAEGNVLGGKSPVEYTRDYLERNKTFAEHRVGGARCMLWLAKAGVAGSSTIEEAAKLISTTVRESAGVGTGTNVLSAAFCRELLIDLRQEGLTNDLVADVATSCRALYPRASCF